MDPPRHLVLTVSDRLGDVFDLVTVERIEHDRGTQMTFSKSGHHLSAEQCSEAEIDWRSFHDLQAGLVARK